VCQRTKAGQSSKAAWPKAIEIVRLLNAQGVRLLAGSDAPDAWLPAGIGFHRELELLVQAGIPEAKVIRIATRNAAIALGLLHEVGTIESGKRADLVLLRSDPLDDIRNLRDIEFVMKDGRFYFVEESESGTGGQQRSRRLVRSSTTAALNPDGPAAASSRSR
jgi:imidazolonepropionase-like amidohydrolase